MASEIYGSPYDVFSRPLTDNPLKGFKSYTYHFALVAVAGSAGGAAVLSELSNNTALDAYYRDPADKAVLLSTAGGQYVVLFNSTIDAEFTIKSFKFENTLIQNIATISQGMGISSTTNSMSILVEEPYTIDFIGGMLGAADSLGVGNADLKYAIKIWFTGYTDSGDIQHITDVKPLAFIINGIDFALTQQGATYKIDCSPLNGASDIQFISNVGGGSFKTGEQLRVAITDLNAMLNRLSTGGPVAPINQTYIKYNVTLCNEYQQANYTLTNLNINNLDQFSGDLSNMASGDKGKSVDELKNIHITTEKSDTVNTIIEKILSLCPEITKDMSGQRVGDDVISYVQNIRTEVLPQPDNGILVAYFIDRKQIRVEKAKADQVNTEAKSDFIPSFIKNAIEAKSYLEYDYIYTGKNTEVTKFLMSMPLALNNIGSHIHIQPSVSTDPISQDTHNNAIEQQATSSTPVESIKVHEGKVVVAVGVNSKQRANDDGKPVLMPPPVSSKPNDSGTHTYDAASFTQYRKQISNYISNTTTSAVLETRGNPFLLNALALPVGVLGDGNGQPADGTTIQQRLQEHANKTPYGGMTSFMPIVKINVRVPKKSVYQGQVSDPDYENAFSTKFLDDINYTIQTIEHSFESGVFTQRMALVGYPTNDVIPSNESRTDPTTHASGFNGPGKKSKSNPGGAVQNAPGVVKQIKGRKAPTAEQQDIINKAAAKYGVDPKLVEAVIRQESQFNPGAINRGSQAKGLMQIVPNTVKEIGSISNAYDQEQNINGGTGYLAAHIQKYDGDLVKGLASYNWGPGNVRRWIRHGADFNQLPAETKTYITRITGDYGSMTTQKPTATYKTRR